MERVSSELRSEFERWCKQIPPEGPHEIGKVTIRDALKAHVLLIDAFRDREAGEGVGGVGPRSMGLLASAIDRQNVGLGQVAKWTNVFEWTATTFYGMVKNHPFHDGNKRTGLLLGLGRRVTTERKVLDIGFPNWKTEVGQSTIAKIRKATGLTPENGIDSQVFFKDLEPMQSLIDLYYEPLHRLADK